MFVSTNLNVGVWHERNIVRHVISQHLLDCLNRKFPLLHGADIHILEHEQRFPGHRQRLWPTKHFLHLALISDSLS